MAVLANRAIGGLRYPSGPVESAPLLLARGQVVLDGGGLATESVPGFPAGATGVCSYDNPAAGASTGRVRCGYDSTTGLLSIRTTPAGASPGARVNWFLYYG